jgi:catechol 2,3-dioxygenase-like lactoylglutathione lyase family enzyme
MTRPGLSFSHMGFFVHDIKRMEDFYARVLEFTVTDRGPLAGPNGTMNLVFLSRDPDEHHQVVLISGRPESLPFNPINQISFKADSLATLKAMHRRLQEAGSRDIIPVTHGNAVSVYALDPEGNRIELYIDTPWYVEQPMRVPVDLTLDEATLMATVEAHARTLPGFRPRDVWRAEMARRMGIG